MSYNDDVIAEFRANGGKVGGNFEGAPLLLLHSTGARSGQERVTPVMYQERPEGWAIFASYAGAPEDPAWYGNLAKTPAASIEVGTESVDVTSTELKDAARDEVWEKQKQDYPGFAEYEEKTTRTIPVLLLTRRR